MAKKKRSDKKLYESLRGSGVRKKVAAKVSEALPKGGAPKAKPARKAAADLTAAADTIRSRVPGTSSKRSAAAKKAARTRKAKASKRSAAGRKAAKTRAKKS